MTYVFAANFSEIKENSPCVTAVFNPSSGNIESLTQVRL
jgi:ABC-type cobalt transport system substrate-binding protein